ncbi:hypothetical protein FBY35_2989 [Streptomyces sp. SLBN-118]|uniref:hypothetical protein n=1 Tax=Streptomyces sp. SLBN-118 TaxID=2768454 RepID=UPI0011508228|nr:hypothetical protein [Streptomyces sp. SLBN-118]TQK52548.1 hypothetical protein FBY35_2989 [Streptomyces sp. SLBN-118]
MNLDPFVILTTLGGLALRTGVMTAFITVGVMGLLVGLIALATRRARGRWTDAEVECAGLESFTWNDPE